MSNYTKKVEALIKGDNAKATAEKNQKQLQTAIKAQLASKEGFRLDIEEEMNDAEQRVELVLLNGGVPITSKGERDGVLQRYFEAKLELEKVTKKMETFNMEVQWLEEASDLIK